MRSIPERATDRVRRREHVDSVHVRPSQQLGSKRKRAVAVDAQECDVSILVEEDERTGVDLEVVVVSRRATGRTGRRPEDAELVDLESLAKWFRHDFAHDVTRGDDERGKRRVTGRRVAAGPRGVRRLARRPGTRSPVGRVVLSVESDRRPTGLSFRVHEHTASHRASSAELHRRINHELLAAFGVSIRTRQVFDHLVVALRRRDELLDLRVPLFELCRNVRRSLVDEGPEVLTLRRQRPGRLRELLLGSSELDGGVLEGQVDVALRVAEIRRGSRLGRPRVRSFFRTRPSGRERSASEAGRRSRTGRRPSPAPRRTCDNGSNSRPILQVSSQCVSSRSRVDEEYHAGFRTSEISTTSVDFGKLPPGHRNLIRSD